MNEGVDLREQVKVTAVSREGNGIAVIFDEAGFGRRVKASDLLVAAGRQPNVRGLNLEAAGIEHQ